MPPTTSAQTLGEQKNSARSTVPVRMIAPICCALETQVDEQGTSGYRSWSS